MPLGASTLDLNHRSTEHDSIRFDAFSAPADWLYADGAARGQSTAAIDGRTGQRQIVSRNLSTSCSLIRLSIPTPQTTSI